MGLSAVTVSFETALGQILASRMAEMAQSDAAVDFQGLTTEQIIPRILNADSVGQPEVWTWEARRLLELAKVRSRASNGGAEVRIPDMVDNALKVWADPASSAVDKEVVIPGIRIYFERTLGQQLKVLESAGRKTGWRPVSPQSLPPPARTEVPASVSPRSQMVPADGGLGILRKIINEAPKAGVDAYIRRAIDVIPHPMAVAKAFTIKDFGHLSWVNPAFCETFKWRETDIVRLSVAQFLNPEDSFVSAALKMLMGMGEFKARPIRGLLGTARDIPASARRPENYVRCKGAGILWHGIAMGIFTDFSFPA